jgi:hypothetical protein
MAGFKVTTEAVSILEEGGRLGLKCLLLSYFRVGDYTSMWFTFEPEAESN